MKTCSCKKCSKTRKTLLPYKGRLVARINAFAPLNSFDLYEKISEVKIRPLNLTVRGSNFILDYLEYFA